MPVSAWAVVEQRQMISARRICDVSGAQYMPILPRKCWTAPTTNTATATVNPGAITIPIGNQRNSSAAVHIKQSMSATMMAIVAKPKKHVSPLLINTMLVGITRRNSDFRRISECDVSVDQALGNDELDVPDVVRLEFARRIIWRPICSEDLGAQRCNGAAR